MNTFLADLAIGQQNQEVVFRDLKYRGIDITPTEGKHPFDGYLPDGRSVEVKLDLYSQSRHYAAIEAATLSRNADFYVHTLCYYVVLPGNVLYDLYNRRGKIPERGGFGDQNQEGRFITTNDMRGFGLYGDQFSKTIKP